jgi:hypothetical protein
VVNCTDIPERLLFGGGGGDIVGTKTLLNRSIIKN